jgi:hypothetical protein
MSSQCFHSGKYVRVFERCYAGLEKMAHQADREGDYVTIADNDSTLPRFVDSCAQRSQRDQSDK